MNYYITILQDLIAGLLVNLVIFFLRKFWIRTISKLSYNNYYIKRTIEKPPLLERRNSNHVSYLFSIRLSKSVHLTQKKLLQHTIFCEEKLLPSVFKYENQFGLNEYLTRINPHLWNIWKGAIETFNSDNSDKVRQFSVGIRELFTHFLHLLAPDDKVSKWNADPSYYHDERPTRRARIEYICRNNRGLFMKSEIKTLLEFLTNLQEGTHSLNCGFTEEDLIA